MGIVLYSSDWHLGHDRDFIVAERGHGSLAEHDEAILQHWRTSVTNADDLIFAGDMLMGPDKLNRALALLTSMPYRTFHWVQGNHDPRFDKLEGMLPQGRDIRLYPMGSNPLIHGRTVSHFPPGLLGVRFDDQRDFSRYAPKMGPGQFVHGHTHSKSPGNSIGESVLVHVGWDAHGAFLVLPDAS